MNKILISLTFLLVVATLVSCKFSYDKKVYGEGKTTSVTFDEFARVIKDTTIQLVDVRTPEEYSQGAIPGSINIDVKSGKFGASADSLLNRENTVAIYCRSGRRSKEAAKTLNLMGFDVIELDKGYNSWVEAHLNR